MENKHTEAIPVTWAPAKISYSLNEVKPSSQSPLEREILRLSQALEEVDKQKNDILQLHQLEKRDVKVVSLKSDSSMGVEDSYCDCGHEIRSSSDYAFHKDKNCPNRIIQCKHPGCKENYIAHDKEKHERYQCIYYRRRDELLKQKQLAMEPIICDQCQQMSINTITITRRTLAFHLKYMCPKRLISCKYLKYGCKCKFPFELQFMHETTECRVAANRRILLKLAAAVNAETICNWCGMIVKRRKLLDHQEDDCLERERRCPNAQNGCPEWVAVGKFEEHLKNDCIVTKERSMWAERSRQMQTPTTCTECGETGIKFRHLPRHLREICISRIVPCRNAAHGCKARLRFRDRHLHEDFAYMNKDRSVLRFVSDGTSQVLFQHLQTSMTEIIHQSSVSKDMQPPWTAEYFVWMIGEEEEILSLLEDSWKYLEIFVIHRGAHAKWMSQVASCKERLKDLKEQDATSKKRKHKKKKSTTDNPDQDITVMEGVQTSEKPINETKFDISEQAKFLAEEYEIADQGVLDSKNAMTLAKGWYNVLIEEAWRLFQELDANVQHEIKKTILINAQNSLITHAGLAELTKEETRAIGDIELAIKLVQSSTEATSKSNTEEEKNARIKVGEQQRLLGKRSEYVTLLSDVKCKLDAINYIQRKNQAKPQELVSSQREHNDQLRLLRKYEREIQKVDKKLSIVSDSTPIELLQRRGRHVIASSSNNAISLVNGRKGYIAFHQVGKHGEKSKSKSNTFNRKFNQDQNYNSLTTSSPPPMIHESGTKQTRKQSMEVSRTAITFRVRLERKKWHHIVFTANTSEITLILNGKTIKSHPGLFEFPFTAIGDSPVLGASTSTMVKLPMESFRGYIQELRLWRECRSLRQVTQSRHKVLKTYGNSASAIAGYWTMEEGMGELLDDVSLSLPRAACINTKWASYGLIDTRKLLGEPPTPSFRDKASCFVNVKLKSLALKAKDREVNIVTCTLGCGRDDIKLKLLEAHLRLECPNRMVVCPEIGCNQIFRYCMRAEHLRDNCGRAQYRAKLAANFWDKEKVVECELRCGERMKKRKVLKHITQQCVNRIIQCPQKDCDVRLPAVYVTFHLTYMCRSKYIMQEQHMIDNARARYQKRLQMSKEDKYK